MAKKKPRDPRFCGEHVVCVVTKQRGGDLHHVYSQRAHPHLAHEPWNLLPVSHYIHLMIHQYGLRYVANEFPAVRRWLERNGWTYDTFARKWMHLKVETNGGH